MDRSALNQEASMPSNPRPKVLCVDDDEDSREMLSTLLRFSRIETRAVATAAQALSLIQAERFDLYLLDAWLPDLDGFELCRRMRAFDLHTPILFFSGAGCDADKKRGMEAGANAYVVKPDLDGLVGRMKQFVSNAESAATQVIRAGRDVCIPPPFTFEIARAPYAGPKR
jgi:DNA-binding response OmpR family regulator